MDRTKIKKEIKSHLSDLYMDADDHAIDIALDSLERYVKYQSLCEEHGEVQVSEKNGYSMMSGYYNVMKNERQAFMDIAGKLGLTPEARKKIMLKAKKEESPFKNYGT